MAEPEYLGPLCAHVCWVCGGCATCCPGHNDAPAFSDDLADKEESHA